MQRMILESLDESKRWMGEVQVIKMGTRTMVQGKYPGHKPDEQLPYTVRVNGKIVYLSDGEYDLAATLAFLAEKQGFEKISVSENTTGCNPTNTYLCFNVSFWRAVRHLIRRGCLIRLQEKSNRIVSKKGK